MVSFRIGLYDLFSHTVPGVFSLFLFKFILDEFGIVDTAGFDIKQLNLFGFILLAGCGFVVGILIDEMSYRWLNLWVNDNSAYREWVFDQFNKKYPWANLKLKPNQWAFMLQSIRAENMEVASSIDHFNSIAKMLRSFFLILSIASFSFLMLALFVNPDVRNLLASAGLGLLAWAAMRKGHYYRKWFYEVIIETYLVQSFSNDTLRNAVFEIDPSEFPILPSK